MDEPTDFQSASKDTAWQEAINSEITSILKNRTWDVVDRPSNRKPITAKWLFKLKKNARGEINKRKARIVARGFQQKEGVDYNDIFAPVVKWSTILAIIALAAKYNWPLHQLDVITVFLNGTIDEDILMEIPDGFPGCDDSSKVCKINRALYGLKQSPKAWYDRISKWLQEHGLTQSKSDCNLYFCRRNGKLTILLLYVDDLIITGDDQETISKLKTTLQQEFEMTDLGDANSYLGVDIHRQPTGIFINQKGYITKLLEKFNLQNCNPTNIPIDPKIHLQKEMGTGQADPELYRSLVGSLIYLTHTRPDLSYAVSCVSRYMQAPENAHYQAAKKILRYLRGTMDYGLFFPSNNEGTFHTYANADWGRDLDTRRSTSGILHKLGNSSIYWSSKLQPTVSLSSTESEYRVLTDAAKDIIHFRRLLQEH